MDENRVRFVLSRPFPLFLQALVHFQIVSRQYHQDVGEEEFARKPVGAGPFRFTGGTVKTGIVLERFADYYGGAPELPPVGPAGLERVIFLQRVGLGRNHRNGPPAPLIFSRDRMLP